MKTKIAQSTNPQLKNYQLPSNWNCTPKNVIALDFSQPALDLSDFNEVVKQQILFSLENDEKLLQKLKEKTKNTEMAKNFLDQYPDQFVLLIDEYDSPLNRCLYDKTKFEELSKGFYETFFNTVKILAQRDKIHKCVITGILKFSQVGVFSG